MFTFPTVFPAYFQSRDYDVADAVDFVTATGDKIDFNFVASRVDKIYRIGDKGERTVDFVASVYADL